MKTTGAKSIADTNDKLLDRCQKGGLFSYPVFFLNGDTQFDGVKGLTDNEVAALYKIFRDNSKALAPGIDGINGNTREEQVDSIERIIQNIEEPSVDKIFNHLKQQQRAKIIAIANGEEFTPSPTIIENSPSFSNRFSANVSSASNALKATAKTLSIPKKGLLNDQLDEPQPIDLASSEKSPSTSVDSVLSEEPYKGSISSVGPDPSAESSNLSSRSSRTASDLSVESNPSVDSSITASSGTLSSVFSRGAKFAEQAGSAVKETIKKATTPKDKPPLRLSEYPGGPSVLDYLNQNGQTPPRQSFTSTLSSIATSTMNRVTGAKDPTPPVEQSQSENAPPSMLQSIKAGLGIKPSAEEIAEQAKLREDKRLAAEKQAAERKEHERLAAEQAKQKQAKRETERKEQEKKAERLEKDKLINAKLKKYRDDVSTESNKHINIEGIATAIKNITQTFKADTSIDDIDKKDAAMLAKTELKAAIKNKIKETFPYNPLIQKIAYRRDAKKIDKAFEEILPPEPKKPRIQYITDAITATSQSIKNYRKKDNQVSK